jgi:branched-chain amino acid aminotransferase
MTQDRGAAHRQVDRQVWIDGKLVPWADATLHVFAQSTQRGYLAFDVLSCHWLPGGPQIFGLREHAQRFLQSAELAGMRLRLDLDGVIAAIGQAVRANRGASWIKITCYYGAVSADLLPVEEHATVAVAAYSPEDVGASTAPPPPIRLQIAKIVKLPAEALSPQAKLAGSYTYAAIAKARARADGFDDVLLLDRGGAIAEGPVQSFFWVDGVDLCTAPLDVVLAGVTRRAVIELARDEGIEIREARAPADRLAHAEEAFITGTTTGIRAVARVGDWRLPEPVPGPITARLGDRLRRMLAGEDAKFSPRWLQGV